MSASDSEGPYRILFTPAASRQLPGMRRRTRMTLERELMEFARLAGLREWLSPDECQEPLHFKVGCHEVTYHLEPGVRLLRVTSVRAPAGERSPSSGKDRSGK